MLAIYNHDGEYMDVNPEARAVRPPAGVPIQFGVNDPKQNTRNLSSWGRGNPSTTRGVHPDTNTMLQSGSKGGVGILSVIGRNVCTSCQTNTRLIAASQDLSNLVVNEYTSGNVYLFNGYNEYFSSLYKEGGKVVLLVQT